MSTSNQTRTTPQTTIDFFTAFEASQPFVKHRIDLFEAIQKKNLEDLLSKKCSITAKFTPKNGEPPKDVKGEIGEITAYKVALEIDPKIARTAVIAKVNGNLFDLHRPLEEDCTVEFFEFGTEEGSHVFWHSSAHALGECLEILHNGKLTIGPALEDCFYYDADLGEKKISTTDYPEIEKTFKKVVSPSQRFERAVLTKSEALEMFRHNPYKVQLINEKIAEDAFTSAYRCGPLIDLCRGPHLPSTGYIKAFKILKHSGCYWKANSDNKQLQRVYGLSFPNKKLLKERVKQIALAKERDHRVIGTNQKLFFSHELSPGSFFWWPKGTIIFNKLLALIRSEYRKRGYEEVISPNIYNMKLWETSGHAAKYKENMFCLPVENQEFALKSMNCPGHCLMFKERIVSYRDLPMRFADFGVLHRNELTGALSGLSRVRRFQQDDAHIFCTVDMISKEIKDCLEFMKDIYQIFGFEFRMNLSTRPEKYIGKIEVWDKAEKALEEALNHFGFDWSLNEGDGAFYGPKIDVLLKDALGRKIQCATVQLDFNLPSKEHFDLKYKSSTSSEEKPVIIHRALLGSVERFVSILTEHYGGKWPFWLSPRQVCIVPLSEKFLEFADELERTLRGKGFDVETDKTDNKVEKKVRSAELLQFNFILVVGGKEKESNIFTVRKRGVKKLEKIPFEQMIENFQSYLESKTNEA